MRVAVLKGGRSLERQVSLRSGARVEDALQALGHEVIGLDAGEDLVRRLRELRPEVAFIAMHGADGEDGTVQSLLELLEIPYTGPRVAACQRAFDKLVELARQAAPLSRLAILHTRNEEKAEELRDALSDIHPPDTDIPIVEVTPVIGVHVGPKGLGLSLIRETESRRN